MRTLALVVAASLVWSSPAVADPQAPASALPPLPPLPPPAPAPPAGPPEPAPAPLPPSGTPPAPPSATSPTPPSVTPPAPPSVTTPGAAPPPTTERTSCCSLRPIHHDFYLRLTSGAAGVSVTGTAPGGGTASVGGLGSQAGVAIGGSPWPGFAIGADFEVGMVTGTFQGGPEVVATTTYRGSTPPTTETLTGHAQGDVFLVGGFVDWFPDPHGGWHLGGSIGVGGATIEDDAYHTLKNAALGLGASGGYDWWMNRYFSVGLTAVVAGSLPATATDNGGNDSGYRFGSFMFSLGGQLLYY